MSKEKKINHYTKKNSQCETNEDKDNKKKEPRASKFLK